MNDVDNNINQWIQQNFQKPLDNFDIHSMSNLSLPHYKFFLIEQKDLRNAGDIYVMSDGNETLLASKANFSHILQQESYLDNPNALTAPQLAELILRIAEGRSDGIITDSDVIVDDVDVSSFSPPSIQQTGEGIVVEFWSLDVYLSEVSRWTVHIDRDYQVDSKAMVLKS